MRRACHWVARLKTQDVLELPRCTAVILIEAVVHRVSVVNFARCNGNGGASVHFSPDDVDAPTHHPTRHGLRSSREANLVRALWRGVLRKDVSLSFREAPG